MSSFTKVKGISQIAHLLSRLKREFPISKSMWQVVRDTKDGLMEASFYTDGWPNFTTVISQEFKPRMSEVADIRIHTSSQDKERVMQIIDGAKLLDNTGKWQAILYFTAMEDEGELLSKYLLESLSSHKAASGKVVSQYALPLHHVPLETLGIRPAEYQRMMPQLPGLAIRDMQPEHAELVARNWTYRDWFSETHPFQHKVRYVKELMEMFDAVGVFAGEKPISWLFKKPGGIQGISYTLPEYREKNLFLSLAEELTMRAMLRDEVVLGEPKRWREGGTLPLIGIGQSNVIVLHEPAVEPTVRSNM